MVQGRGFPGDADYVKGDERPTSETVERRETHVYHHSSKDSQNTDPNPSPAPTPSSSTSRSSPTQGSRTIVGLMFFAVTFSLIGNEIKVSSGKAGTPVTGPVTEGGKIIIGGVFATALLTLLSHAGENGRQFAVGLALVTTATSVLVFGAPVWDSANSLFGSKPTTPVGGTAATTPTHGTATVAALAQAA